MKTKELALHLQRKNRGKSLNKIGNEREDVGHLSDLIYKEGSAVMDGSKIVGVTSETVVELYKNGQRRAARRKNA